MSEIDDSMSGTTAILALVRGTQLFVANVGDSRAVLAERNGHILTAKDLSWDQTPMRADECARVMSSGARVLTLEQLHGAKDSTIQDWTSKVSCCGKRAHRQEPAQLAGAEHALYKRMWAI
jgi:serine/threonine protein phosphatase PrpC